MRIVYAIFLFLSCLATYVSANNSFVRVTEAKGVYHADVHREGEFHPMNAVVPGPAYFCSRGNHASDEVITWTGFFEGRRRIGGVSLEFQYAPAMIRVAVSQDGEHFTPVQRTFTSLGREEPSFGYDYLFPHPQSAMAIRVDMKGPINKYFGLQQVKLVPSGEPLQMIVSGVSTPQREGDYADEFCLQAEGGSSDEGTRVVLASCVDAMAAGDGREIFRFTHTNQVRALLSDPPMCLSVGDGEAQDGSQVVLQSCEGALQEQDGRSQWALTETNQLQLLQGEGLYCLSQRGDAPGSVNLLNDDAEVEATSSAEEHGAELMIDKDASTYWASQLVDSPGLFQVEVVATLPSSEAGSPPSAVEIDWEFPPIAYAVDVSRDNVEWTRVITVDGNAANRTVDLLGDAADDQTGFVRVTMLRPHPTWGRFGRKYLYGIRSLSVSAHRMLSIVEPCTAARQKNDCRDKFFPKQTVEFDPAGARDLSSNRRDFKDAAARLDAIIADLEGQLAEGRQCARTKQRYSSRLQSARRSLLRLQQGQYEVANGPLLALESLTLNEDGTWALDKLEAPGASRVSPAESCGEVQRHFRLGGSTTAPSGFYWILHKCGTAPIRAYCDFEQGGMYYPWNAHRTPGRSIKDKVETVEDIRYRCAEIGLEPFVPRSAGQVRAVQKLLLSLGFDLRAKKAVPLAVDYECATGDCSGDYRDLHDGGSELTDLLEALGVHEPLELLSSQRDAAGLGYGLEGAFFFDLAGVDVQAIVCSTNAPLDMPEEPHAAIQCTDTLAVSPDNLVFQGEEGTSFLVSCPRDCLREALLDSEALFAFRQTPLIGDAEEEDSQLQAVDEQLMRLGIPSGSAVEVKGYGVYPPETSPCLAAIMEGIINPLRGGRFTVGLQGGRSSFPVREGQQALNGVISRPLLESRERSFVVARDAQACPIELFESSMPAANEGLSFRALATHRPSRAAIGEGFIADPDRAESSDPSSVVIGRAFESRVALLDRLMETAETEKSEARASHLTSEEREALQRWNLARQQTSCEGEERCSEPGWRDVMSPVDRALIEENPSFAQVSKSEYKSLAALAADSFANAEEDLARRVVAAMSLVAVGMDPSSVEEKVQESVRVLTQARGIIKPAADLYRTQNGEVFSAKETAEEVAGHLSQLLSQVASVEADSAREARLRVIEARREALQHHYAALATLTSPGAVASPLDSAEGSVDFGLFDLKTLNVPPPALSAALVPASAGHEEPLLPSFDETWRAWTPSPHMVEGGAPAWSYARTSSRPRVVVLEGRGLRVLTDPKAHPGVGAFLSLRDRTWYHPNVSVAFKPQTSGRVGIALKYRSPSQHYLVEITQMARHSVVKVVKKAPWAHDHPLESTPKVEGPGVLLFEAALPSKLSPSAFYRLDVAMRGSDILVTLRPEQDGPALPPLEFTHKGVRQAVAEEAAASGEPLLEALVRDLRRPLQDGSVALFGADAEGPVFFDNLRVSPAEC